MGRYIGAVCRLCRRQGEKLFLKGEKCLSPKCPLIRKSYPPGPRHKRRRGPFVSEYGKQLSEKQKLQKYYGIREKQFRKYVGETLKSRSKIGDATLLLIKRLEKRLDNVVFKLGLARSRRAARQLVSHGYFMVNSRPVNIPSFEVKKGQIVSLKKTKRNKNLIKNLTLVLKNYQVPDWLKLNQEKLEGKIIKEPSGEDIGVPLDVSAIFEFYSR